MKKPLKTLLLATASIALCLCGTAHATTYTWTTNATGTQDWSTPGNWASSTVFVDGTGNELTFFGNVTASLANGINDITTNVPATLTMGNLTLNGKSPTTSGQIATINIASSASTWTLGGASPTVNLNGVNSTGTLAYDVKANLTLGATTLFTGTGSASFTFSGAIGESASGYGISKNGTSTLTLSGNNTYTGSTTVNAGKLVVGHANALGTTEGGTTVNGSGASGFGVTLTLNDGITVTGEALTLATNTGNRSSLTTRGTAKWDGNITLSGTAEYAALVCDGNATSLTIGTSTATSVTSNGATLFLRGVGTNATGTVNSALNLGTGSLLKADSSAWTINSTDNDYTGVTQIGYGILSFSTITNGGENSSIGKNATIWVGQYNASAQSTGTLQFTGLSGGSTNREIVIQTGNNATVTNNIGKGVIENTVAGQTLALSGNVSTSNATLTTSLTLTGAGNGELSGSIINSPKLSLIKSGAGTWMLAGNNTHTGTTTVSAGTLIIASSTALASSTGNVLVSAGNLTASVAAATLGGNLSLSSTGTFDTATTGTGIVTLVAGKSFTMSGGQWKLNIEGISSFDSINSAGSTPKFTISGGTIDLTGSALAEGTYQVLSGFNIGTSTVAGLGFTGYDPAQWTIALNTAGILNIAAIPEPGTWILVGIGLAFLLCRKPRRRLDS